jgi:hypothetical protein
MCLSLYSLRKNAKKCQAFYTRLLCISLDINDLTGFVFTQLATRKGLGGSFYDIGMLCRT